MISPVITPSEPSTTQSYTSKHALEFQKARELYKKHRAVKYYNGWVMIGGIAINGISEREMKKIEKEVNSENQSEVN